VPPYHNLTNYLVRRLEIGNKKVIYTRGIKYSTAEDLRRIMFN
jgi:hypothetical protein